MRGANKVAWALACGARAHRTHAFIGHVGRGIVAAMPRHGLANRARETANPRMRACRRGARRRREGGSSRAGEKKRLP